MSLVVGVVEYKTPLGFPKLGLCTGEFVQASLGTKIPGFFRPAVNFSLPKDTHKPVLMVGAGSGIAPFRGFWQERQLQSAKGLPVGATSLFYGCRVPGLDLLRDETDMLANKQGVFSWALSLLTGGSLEFERYTALSRAPGTSRRYVQDLLVEEGARVWKLWQEQGGSLYVCGKISMAAGVQEGLENICQEFGGISRQEAKELLDKMRAEGRYQEDIFGNH